MKSIDNVSDFLDLSIENSTEKVVAKFGEIDFFSSPKYQTQFVAQKMNGEKYSHIMGHKDFNSAENVNFFDYIIHSKESSLGNKFFEDFDFSVNNYMEKRKDINAILGNKKAYAIVGSIDVLNAIDENSSNVETIFSYLHAPHPLQFLKKFDSWMGRKEFGPEEYKAIAENLVDQARNSGEHNTYNADEIVQRVHKRPQILWE